MTTQPPLPIEEPVDNPEESTYTEYGSGQEAAADVSPSADTTSIEQSPAVDSTPPQTEQQSTAPTTYETDIESEKIKLAEQQAKYNAQLERDRTIQALENEALQMEKQLMDQGLTESDAKARTYNHLENRVQQIQQQQNLQSTVQIEQGKRNASVHFAKQYNLGIDSLGTLEKAQTPQEMESIAKNISSMAKLERENAELKARLAPQQSFDTNTPTPAAATNDERLLDAYLGGDRSEAASKAAAKLLGI
jgi:hypothetical protein